jgi:DNA-binding transcriptional LysR family regulator
VDDREVFFQVVEAHGFAAAARRLATTPASVSRRVKALERRLGVRLLQRTTRKLTLTEAGQRYFDAGRRLLRELDDLLEEAADLAIRIGYPADSSMVVRSLAAIPRYACAAPEYLQRRGCPRTPVDLLQHDCLHYNLISEREEWTFLGPNGEHTLAINGHFCSNNGDVLARAAIQGLGIVLLPDFIVERALADGRLVRVLTDYERQPLSLFALYPSRHHVPAKTRGFLQFLLEQFAASP